MAYTNTDILSNKLDEMEIFLHENDIDIITVTEVNNKRERDVLKAGDPVPENKFKIDGYKYIENSSGRGVGMFIKDHLVFVRNKEYEARFSPSIFGKVVIDKNEYFTVGILYRSPNSGENENTNFLNQIDFISSKFLSSKEKLLLVGDFNFPGINWDDECSNMSDTDIATKFLNITQQNYLTQFVTEVTHRRNMQTPTLIDLVLSNDPEFVQNVEYHPPFGKSHHSVLTFSLPIKLNKNDNVLPTLKFQINKGDYEAMRTFMREVNWEELLKQEDDIDKWWSVIEGVLNEAKLKFVPQISMKKSTVKRSFTAPSTLLDKLKLKRKAYKQYKKYPTVSNFNLYAKYRNQVKWETRKAKKCKEQQVAFDAKTNPKALFQYIASKTKSKETITNLLRPDGTLSESTLEACEILNKYFASVFTEEGEGELPSFNKFTDTMTMLNDVTISTDDMCKTLKSLKVSKSPGPDEIHPRILKELAEELCHPLTLLFNKSLNAGKIPTKWKVAEVRPIFKKGSKVSAGNYRPVSLTSVVCKVFENFIRNAMYSHLVTNNLLSDKQFGFCKGRSCVTQLLVSLHDWLSELDKNVPVDVMYLDFRKAFDSVPHKRLVHKLKGYGVGNKVLNWVSDFLTDRTQYVSLDGVKSDTIPVTSGVPQGSVLGPTLFIYYINDLPDVVDTLLKIFADDTKNYSKVVDDSDRLMMQTNCDNLVQWSIDWLLGFNCDKCNVLHLGKNNPRYTYTIKNNDKITIMKETKCEKDLGVHIDPELNFNEHILKQTQKARSLSGMIMRTFVNKTRTILVPIYKALIRPVVEYGNPVWCPYLRKDIDQIEKIQRDFTRNIIGMKDLDYEERLKLLRLPSLEYRRIRGDMIEVYKILNNLYDSLTTNSLLTSDNNNITRGHNFKLQKGSFNTTKYKYFFTNRVVNLWNKLSDKVVNAPSLNVFKNNLDAFMNAHIYSINLDIYEI